MPKYRIKSIAWSSTYAPDYVVQVKYKYIPIWLRCTSRFATLKFAENHIETIMKEVGG